jgi:hypothetical protein
MDQINLGRFLAEAGQTTEAKELLRRGEKNLETLLRAHPEDLEYRGDLAECLSVRGMLHRESGAAGALPTYRRAREILETLPHPSADALFILAGVQAQCAALPASDATRPSAGEPAERPVTLDRAMETLRRATAAGFRDVDRLGRDTNLDPLRTRPDFQRLRMDLAFPPDPFSQNESPALEGGGFPAVG